MKSTHGHSPVAYVIFGPRYDLSYKTYAYTGCFINFVTILNLYIIKVPILNCLSSKYYKNIMIYILFYIKSYLYFHNVGLLYDNFKSHTFYDVFK